MRKLREFSRRSTGWCRWKALPAVAVHPGWFQDHSCLADRLQGWIWKSTGPDEHGIVSGYGEARPREHSERLRARSVYSTQARYCGKHHGHSSLSQPCECSLLRASGILAVAYPCRAHSSSDA
eukprot:1959090-Pleurochrysis_carterae.AAC.3